MSQERMKPAPVTTGAGSNTEVNLGKRFENHINDDVCGSQGQHDRVVGFCNFEDLYGTEGGADDHLAPLFRAVREDGCALALLLQSTQPIDAAPPFDRPTMILVGDDDAQALGPAGFHLDCLRRLSSRCHTAVIVHKDPLPILYRVAASVSVVMRQHVLLIETRPEQLEAWQHFLTLAAPKLRLLIGIHDEGVE